MLKLLDPDVWSRLGRCPDGYAVGAPAKLGRVVFMAGKFSFANANAKLTQP
jgi:hypothetical protein